MEAAFALFIWPGIAFGGLIAYGYLASRKPKTAEQKAAEEASALDEARKARQQVEELVERIDTMQATLDADMAEARAAERLRRAQTGQFLVRQRSRHGKVFVARHVHGH